RLSIDGLLQQFDSAAQWQDLRVLATNWRMVENNGYARGSLDWTSGGFALKVSAAYVAGGAGDDDRVDTGQTMGTAPLLYRRNLGYQGADGVVEARYAFGSKSSVIVGSDVQYEDQTVLSYDQVVGSTVTPAPMGGVTKTFSNYAGYAQAIL